MRYLLVTLLVAGAPLTIWPQFYSPLNFPKGYFRNPLSIPIDLSGNFGEMRPNHYHMGLDLRTKLKVNLPVYAAADGYISRIKIEPGGFGRAIYINHPNGFTTVYAHLNDFDPAVERWVKEQQYLQESWKVFLDLGPFQFRVKKGDFIAYSGNTGGSEAPHLHFEIRRTADDTNVNPLLFGLPLPDDTSPKLFRLAVYDRTKSVYEQSPRILPLKSLAVGSFTTIPPVITVSSTLISLAINAFDTHSGSTNSNGIYESVLYVDGVPQTGFRMDEISYNNTRYLNAHIDFKTKANGGSYLQNMSELPGYINSIYKKGAGNGVIRLNDTAIHIIKIVVKDAYQNTSVLQCKIQCLSPSSGLPTPDSRLHIPGSELPISNARLPASNARLFYPLMLDGFESDECEFYIGERCLYDSVHIKYSRAVATSPATISSLHAIGATYIPLQEAYLIRIKPNRALTEKEKSRTVMQWFAGTKKDIQKVDWQSQWAGAKFRDFGFYQLLVDPEPPEILPVGFADGADLSKASRIMFTIKDNLDKFKNVRTELDGKWIRFTNDKGRQFIYQFDEKCLSGYHELKITAEDEAGNLAVKVIRFTR